LSVLLDYSSCFSFFLSGVLRLSVSVLFPYGPAKLPFWHVIQ